MIPPQLSYVVPAVIALIVAWLTARFASIKAHEDRIWEGKAAACAAIFEALHVMGDTYRRPLVMTKHELKVSHEAIQAGWKDYGQARGGLYATIARESWLLPLAAAMVVEGPKTKLEVWIDDPLALCRNGAEAVEAATRDLSSLARSELAKPSLLPRPWPAAGKGRS